MTLKAFLLNLMLMLVASVATSLLVVFGTNYLNHYESSDASAVTSWFSSSDVEEKKLHFVEIKNLVITLKGNSAKERYLLLDLALTAADEAKTLRTENLLLKVKGISIDVLSSMDYNDVRNMSVMELRQLMMDRYQAVFQKIGVTMPFEDVIISKMVFQ